MKKIKEELKKFLTCYLDDWLGEGEYDRANTEDIVDDILNPNVFYNIAVVDRVGDLPFPPHYILVDERLHSIWMEAREAMLIEGWVKEIK